MNVETFMRIAREALTEVLEEQHARECYSFIRWQPAQDWRPGVCVTDLCATLKEGLEEEPGEGQEDMRTGIGKICIPTGLGEVEAKQEIKKKIRERLPNNKYY